jgi:alpha-amylase
MATPVYQGQEQHFSGAADPYNREALWLSGYPTTSPLYQLVKELNAIRSLAINKSSSYLTWHAQIVYSDAHNIAFRKGNASYMILMVVNNVGSSSHDYSILMPAVGFPTGLKVIDLLTCRTAVVDLNGALQAQFAGGLPMVS